MEKGVNKQAAFSTIGARNYAENDRHKHDFYATDPKALNLLFDVIHIDKNEDIWECCAGLGHLSQSMRDRGYSNVWATELYYRAGALDKEIEFDTDFLFNFNAGTVLDTHIITNPPYVLTLEFAKMGLDLVANGKYVCFWLPIRYLSGIARKKFFDENPLYKIIISSCRISCAMNGEFDKQTSNAIDFAWFVWQKGYFGSTTIVWR